ncbi:hypothetical protein BDD12DRAFT_865592 [Trichophaea hybrida]|nr:hypothetical protein BDD12DRAFT_865592 [Trichophaea hybrida]
MFFYTVLATLAVASLTNASPQQSRITPAPSESLTGIPSLVNKYSTVSGWSAFYTPLESEIQTYMATQTFITGSLATETDTAKLRTEPAVSSFAFEYITIIADHLSTDTHLAPSVRSSLSKDFYGWLSAEATATFASPSATGSSSEEPTDTSELSAGSTGAAERSTTTTKPVDTNTIASATTTTTPVSALPTGNVGSAKMDMLSLSGVIGGVIAGLVAAVAIAL